MKKIFILVLMILGAVLIFVACPSGKKPLPPIIAGPLTVMQGVTDTFSAVTTDPDGDEIKYQFDWGNGEISEWSAFQQSGSVYKVTYTYTNKGIYSVRVKARDKKGKTSDWSNSISVVCGLGIMRWYFTCPDEGDFNSTPAIDDQGNVYIGCSEGHIHSLTQNGQVRWQFTSVNNDEFIASPVIAPNGNVYACDRGGSIYCINPNNGSRIWSKTLSDEIVATPAVDQNSNIYINCLDGFLYAINSQEDELWHQPAGGISSPAIDVNNNIYVGSEEGYLYSYTNSGNLRWRYDIGAEINSSPSILPNGKICFGGQDGYLYILNPDSTLFHREQVGFISTTPVIGTDGAIYVTNNAGIVTKLSSDGNIEWDFETDGVCSSPAVVRYPNISGDIIYFKVSWAKKKQEDIDSLYMIKSDSTRFDVGGIFPVSSLPTEEIVSSPNVSANGTVYIGGGVDFDSEQGGLFALSGRGVVVNSSWPLFRHDTKNSGRAQ